MLAKIATWAKKTLKPKKNAHNQKKNPPKKGGGGGGSAGGVWGGGEGTVSENGVGGCSHFFQKENFCR